METEIWHRVFDIFMLLMAAVWLGQRLERLQRNEMVEIVWECVRMEWRRLRQPGKAGRELGVAEMVPR